MGKEKKEKSEKKKKDKQEKRGNANMDAWEAARKIAKATRKEYKDEEWSRLPWREIRDQLRHNGNVVDMTAVPVSWTSESPQMVKMRLILREAGFKEDGHLFYWEESE
jgi:hypothetical protein